jgi:signal transduction histidine kinase
MEPGASLQKEGKPRQPRADPAELAVLYGINHTFASVSALSEASRSIVEWSAAALASDRTSAQVLLPDRMGRLRSSATIGNTLPSGKGRTATRRNAFDNKAPVLVNLKAPPGHALLTMALACRGEALGVLEISAPRDAIERGTLTLEAVASQGAMALKNLNEKDELERETEALRQIAGLARRLVAATLPETAVRTAVKFCFERFQLPSAGWLKKGDEWLLLAVRGPTRKKREILRNKMGKLHRSRSVDSMAAQLSDVLEIDDVAVIDGGDAVLFVGRAPDSLRPTLELVESLLKDVLTRLVELAKAEQLEAGLDRAIVWTAHEFRGPLLGARTAIEHIHQTSDGPQRNRELLRRSRKELEQLARTVESLLRWSAGAEPLRLRPTNLVRVVREAIESCSLEAGEERVSLSAPTQAIVDADGKHLRAAVANVLRNALAYSPQGSQVSVDVRRGRDSLSVLVKDEGPGIPAETRRDIFEPFVRAKGGRFSRRGLGLGLFIARKVVEAHGGAISLRSNRGTTFKIRLPVRANSQQRPHG